MTAPAETVPSPPAPLGEPSATPLPQPDGVPGTAQPTAVPTDAPAPSPDPTPAPSEEPAPQQSAQPSPDVPTTPDPSPSATVPATGTVTEVPAPVPPSVTTSQIPTATVVVAAIVLALVVLGLVLLRRRFVAEAGRASASGDDATGAGTARHTLGADAPVGGASLGDTLVGRPVPGPGSTSTAREADGTGPTDDAEVVRFLLDLGGALLDAGAPVVQVEDTLRRVAQVNGAGGVQTVVLPTALVVSLPGGGDTHTAAAGAGSRALRLDQVHGVLEVAQDAEHRRVSAREGIVRIATTLASAPLYPPLARLVGYVGLSVGIAMILGGSPKDVLVAALLGAGVAAVQVRAGRWGSAYQALVVLGCAFGVALAAFLLARAGLVTDARVPLVAPLVSFLPGALLTTASIDLATRQMVAGAGRLAAGAMQLLLLAGGITAAAGLVGVPSTVIADAPGGSPSLVWPWVGLLVYGLGVTSHHCVRREAVPWVLLVLVVAYAGQVIGGLLFGGVVSAFVGALVMTPVAAIAAARPNGPPLLVAVLPAFWVLVPGALSLVGLTAFASDQGRSLGIVITAVATMVAVSVGVLSGVALASVMWRSAERRALTRRAPAGDRTRADESDVGRP
ncbi:MULTISPECIES: threonine/serine exporter family protein [unclassified Actinotalea]|uniref:threonine/serine exporter family protein n=1 Tax=unclassified Actinotalea TaxID=2638618 RepID=UPI0015F37611|nr:MULTISPECIES: threonine/serine exporter family protein [unclassified Actinotalea]